MIVAAWDGEIGQATQAEIDTVADELMAELSFSSLCTLHQEESLRAWSLVLSSNRAVSIVSWLPLGHLHHDQRGGNYSSQ